MTRFPIITGLGLVTPLGDTADRTWDALLQGHFINDHALAAGHRQVNRPRAVSLAIQAATEAVHHAGWNHEQLGDPKTLLVVATSKGPVESWITPLSHMALYPYVAGGIDPAGLSHIAVSLSDEFALIGPRLTFSAACASGLHALIRAAIEIAHGAVDRVLVVASEASVHPLFIGSFRRLGVLPPPGVGCRPFDHARRGFLMSEAAAALCIESSKTTHALAILDRFALGGDATHLTGGDPQGQTLRHLLRQVIDNQPIDLVHAHGTGTELNDPTELAAIQACLTKDSPPPLAYSHKGALGHSLGAAGLVAVVLNCLMHSRGVVPPNIRTTDPLPAEGVIIHRQACQREIRRSLAIAAGFGGAMAAVSLRQP